MNKTQKALKMAIEQIKWADHLHDWHDGLYDALEACKEVLAELQEQNPVAYMYETKANDWTTKTLSISLETFLPPDTTVTPLYTSPPKREWRGLSDDEVQTVFELGHKTYREFAKAIQAKLKEVNGYE